MWRYISAFALPILDHYSLVEYLLFLHHQSRITTAWWHTCCSCITNHGSLQPGGILAVPASPITDHYSLVAYLLFLHHQSRITTAWWQSFRSFTVTGFRPRYHCCNIVLEITPSHAVITYAFNDVLSAALCSF
eukprot:scpid96078/ scgid24454/ 